MAYQRSKKRYKKSRTAAASPAFDPRKIAGALYRALARFPEARESVIVELDRVGCAFA
jgi:hypothetical protein